MESKSGDVRRGNYEPLESSIGRGNGRSAARDEAGTNTVRHDNVGELAAATP